MTLLAVIVLMTFAVVICFTIAYVFIVYPVIALTCFIGIPIASSALVWAILRLT